MNQWKPGQDEVGGGHLEGPNLPLHPQFSKDVLVNIYSAYIDNFLNAKDAVRVAKEARPAFLKFLEVPGPGRGMEATLLGPAMGVPGAPSLDTRTLACGSAPQTWRGSPGTCLSLDISIFACHASLVCPSTLFRVSAKHA